MMVVLRVACCLLTAITLLAQGDDVFARLQHVLGSSGVGELAAMELRKGNFAKVEEMLSAARVNGASEGAELLSLQGAVAFMAGKMSASAEDFEQAAAIAPLKDTDTFTLAMALVNLRDDKRARVLIEDLAQRYPGHAVYTYWLGRLDYDQRRYEEAAEELRKAVALDPESARAWDSLGLAFDMQGQMDQALQAFQKAVELNRRLARPSPWPPHDLGFLLLRADKPNAAETALRESLRYDPKLAQTHYYLGRTLEKEGVETQAINEYAIAVSSDSASADACYSLAKLYRKMHRDREANEMFAEYRRRNEALAAASH
jgi:tetratricopeptide (TPR) repeat protein